MTTYSTTKPNWNLDEWFDSTELSNLQNTYEEQSYRGEPSAKTQFDYAYGLVRSTKEDVKLGIRILEKLLKCQEKNQDKRDYLLNLSFAHARLKDYDRALEHVKLLLSVRQGDEEAAELKNIVEKRMKRDGLIGLTMIGLGFSGIAVIGATVIGLLVRRRH